MNRQGLTLGEACAVAGRLEVELLISHLGSASTPGDRRNADQLDRFREARALFPSARASLCASAGVFLGAAYAHDVVRGGVSLYGGGPEDRPDPRLKAVATLTAPVLDVRELQAGDRVSYGSVFTADRTMRVGIVGAGYADGLLRRASGRGRVWMNGAYRSLLAVNMDVSVIRLSEGGGVGDEVELLGPHVLLDDHAAAAGTIAHEVLVRLSARANRVYLGA
jgi:alanine racemase